MPLFLVPLVAALKAALGVKATIALGTAVVTGGGVAGTKITCKIIDKIAADKK